MLFAKSGGMQLAKELKVQTCCSYESGCLVELIS